MISIVINDRELELPEDISFDYVTENRIFSNADGYSFDIEIPLRDSAVNSEIFGMIWDPQADLESMRFTAQLQTPEVSITGIVAIAGISEESVSIQFLEGRSVTNFEEDLEDMYVNELELKPLVVPNKTLTPISQWKSFDDGIEAVPLPWVNDNSGIIQNNAIKDGNGYYWDPDNRGFSYFPFLCVLIRNICEAIGYECDISALEQSRFRHLLVCNALPAALGISSYAAALPHWTVTEFFEKLEIILQGEFDIDNARKHVVFRFTRNIIDSLEPVVIDNPVDEFSADIDSVNEDKSDLDLLKNISFKDNGSRFWKVNSCDWFIRLRKKNPHSGEGWVIPGITTIDESGHRVSLRSTRSLVQYNTMDQFLNTFKGYEYFGYHRNDIIQHNIYYINEVDCYFIFHSTDYLEVTGKGWVHHFEVFPVNEFGSYIVDPEDQEDGIELDTVPVPIDEAEYKCAFLYFSNNADNDVAGDEVTVDSSFEDYDNSSAEIRKILQPRVYQTILNGESEKPEYFDRLNLGFWKGFMPYHFHIGVRPITSNVVIYDNFKYYEFPDFSLRLNHGFSRGIDEYESVDAKKLFKFTFLSDSLPSPRATYVIHGKRYVCAKLTASFSANGMSNLIKGEFYRF